MITELPSDRDAEAAVLGAIIGGYLEPPKADEVISSLISRDDVFYSDSHRDMFLACVKLHNQNKPVDQIAVRDALKVTKSKVRDTQIVEVVNRSNTITALSVDNHVSMLDRLRQQREAIRTLETAREAASRPLADIADLQALIGGVVSSLSELQGSSGVGRDDWPALTDQATITEPPALPPFLVGGLLHQGEKMLLTGRAKAGKSLLLSQLALCVATGTEWLGMPCEKIPVLYILLEGGKPFNDKRFYNLREHLELVDALKKGMLDTFNLAGYDYSLTTFTDRIKAETRGREYGLVVIDPLYMLHNGDENAARDTSRLFHEVDRIAKHFNASVITCHHQTKGSSSSKHVIDRASGSGVFARFQDVGIDLIELDGSTAAQMMDAKGILLPSGTTAWRLEAYCRNAASPEPLNLWRKGIVWEVDEYGELDDARPLEVGTTSAIARTEARQAEHDTAIGDAFRELGAEGKNPTVTELAEYLDAPRSTLDRWISQSQIFETYKAEGRAYRVRQITEQ